MMKRILAFILSLLLVMSSFSTLVFANSYGYSDNQSQETSEWITAEQLQLLYKLGASPWETIKKMGAHVDAITTRSIMAYYVCNILNIGEPAPEAYDTLFKDVSTNHPDFASIKALSEAGIMNGDPTGHFRPDEPITTKETAIVLLRVLGYGPYMAVASVDKALLMTNIMDGIPMSDKITKPQALRMIYNALNSPAIRQSAFASIAGSDDWDISYIIDDEYSGFEHLYGIVHEIGVVDGVIGTDLQRVNTTRKENQVSIAGVTYTTDADLTDLLGFRVNYFYKKVDSGIPELFYHFVSDRNETFELIHNDIDGFSNGIYRYTRNNTEKKISLTAKTPVIFNGVANPSYDDAEMQPDFGKVTFIDNNADGTYDVVKVDSYEFYYASSINIKDKKIYDNESNPSKVLDFSTANDVIIKNGEKVLALDRLKVNSLLAVRRSSGNSNRDKVIVESYSVTLKADKVTAINKKSLTTTTGTYAKWQDLPELKLGTAYNFFMINDEIVYAIISKDGGPLYGYLVDLNAEGTFATSMKFALTDFNGDAIFLDAAKTLYVDGTAYKTNSTTDVTSIRSVLNASAQESNGYSAVYPYAQPIKYVTNASGQLLKIDTVYQGINEDETAMKNAPETKGKLGNYYYYLSSYYDNSDKSILFGSADSRTVTVRVPMTDRLNHEAYNAIYIGNGKTYSMDVIDRDEDSYVPEVIYIYYDNSSVPVSVEERPFVVADLRQELNEDGDVECIIEGYKAGQKVKYTGKKEVYDSLSVGDVVVLIENPQMEVLSYELLLDIDKVPAKDSRVLTLKNNTSSVAAPYQSSNDTRIVYGTLLAKDGQFLRVTQGLESDLGGLDVNWNTDNYKGGSASIIKYTVDRGLPTVTAGSGSDLIPYVLDPANPSVVAICITYSGVNQVYVIDK